MSEEKSHKILFVGLLLVTCTLLFLVAALLWWIPYVGLANIHRALPALLAVFFGTLLSLAVVGILSIVLTLVFKKDLLLSKRLRGAVIKIIFPVLI